MLLRIHGFSFLIIIILASSLLLFQSVSGHAKEFELTGQVLDLQNNAISKAEIIVWTGNSKLRETRADFSGRYNISFPPTRNRIRVTYLRSDFVAAKVDDLSGERSHNINKVLLPMGTRLSRDASYNAFSTYDFLFQAGSIMERKTYATAVQKLTVPRELNNHRVALLTQYGISGDANLPVSIEGTIIAGKGQTLFLKGDKEIFTVLTSPKTKLDGFKKVAELKPGQTVSVSILEASREASHVELMRKTP